jgi:hypothetical protein
MDNARKVELRHLVESCRETDSTDLDAEKTAAIGELLIEVEELELVCDLAICGCRKSCGDDCLTVTIRTKTEPSTEDPRNG